MNVISIRGASEHNLKGFDLDLPRNSLVVVSGVSGSGKSSLVFDTIGREAQRRYLESFSSYARQFLGRVRRPAVGSIGGLSPAITVDQRTVVRNPRSTVGTLTGLYDDLRLLFARLGQAPDGVTPERQLFSFNSPHGACPVCNGIGLEDRLDPELLIADAGKSLREGALVITTPTGYLIYSQVTIDVLDQVCRSHGFDVDTPWRDLTPDQRQVVLYGSDRIRIPYGKHPLSSRLRWSGITAKPREEGVYKGILPVMEQILKRSRNRNILRFVRSLPCRACGGTRLRPEALAVRLRGRHIGEEAARDIDALRAGFEELRFTPQEAAVGEPIRAAILARADLLQRLGVGHLSLDRVSTSLSGGEAQRVRLAAQVGSDLRGVMYVLDEPSVGLHAAEQRRLLDVLRTLRNRGNTVLVVEHDEETMREADWLVDIGPGAGEAGGEVLFTGTVEQFLAARSEPSADGQGWASSISKSRTWAFLTGAERVERPAARRAGTGVLRVADAARHNLQHLDVDFLAGALNVVTGVSGAGKSSLVAELLARVNSGAGVPAGQSGAGVPACHFAGTEARATEARASAIEKVIHIDQSPIGRTPRSNPATYTGLSDIVRDLFAAQPAAAERGLGKGAFSFNVSGGRCEACQGAGVQQVGMHFLGSVDVVCEVCGGRRFKDEVLEVAYKGHTIAEVLELTLDRAAELLADTSRASRIVAVLRELGLGYLRLGQPSTTLSGGEAQRVKLASELSRPGRAHTLYVLDEPTTGLHSADVAVLLAALNRLVEQGHTVVTIEHQLDVIRSADRVIDLGPGSGRRGGRLVAVGTPEAVEACEESLTGAALRRQRIDGRSPIDERSPTDERSPIDSAAPIDTAAPIDSAVPIVDAGIHFTDITTHNLAIADVTIPPNRFTVVTGVSGSGKSSFAFDTLYAEARNRFTESFSPYARRFLDHPGDARFATVSGLRPAVAVRQRTASRNPRSTVGTMTEIADYYRLLFARVGETTGPSPTGVGRGFSPAVSAGLQPRARAGLTASMFSPNSEQGACPECKGLGVMAEADPERLITHPGRSLLDGAMDGHRTGRFYGERQGQYMAILAAVGHALGLDFGVPWESLEERARVVALHGAGDREFDVEWHYKRGARSGVHRFRSKWLGLVGYVGEEYARKHADRRGEALEPLMHQVACPACRGARLRPERLAVRVCGLDIAELQALTVGESIEFFASFSTRAGARAAAITADLRRDVESRLEKLRDAGVDYLALDRPAATLSAGEAQRVRLASEVGTGLTGITYVLDEPTAGLHARDTERLLRLIGALRDAGNTVVVVEHDLDVIRAADHLIDVGPGPGRAGGRIVAAGTPADVAGNAASPTGRELKRRSRVGRGFSPALCAGLQPRATERGHHPLRPGISVRHATLHNLHDLSVDIPAGGLVAVTGVSGSGKSTLVFDVIAPALHGLDAGRGAGDCVHLHEPFARLVVANREAIAATPSSSPATIMGIATHLRDLFAATDDARARGLSRKHFSTQASGGRCEACEGAGRIRVSMDFLPDVWIRCEECRGRRFRPEVLACRLSGRSITGLLEMSVAEVADFLDEEAGSSYPGRRAIAERLRLLEEIGLGYLQLGQGADALSGGERQRLALAADLAADPPSPSLYLFDEPTTGLHVADVARLLQLFDRLLAAGHSIIAVEHHLDVIAAAHYVIDLGPEGGSGGGRVVATGTPSEIARTEGSWTGAALRRSAVS